MHEILDINTGRVVVTIEAATLQAVSIGSCIAMLDISKEVSIESGGVEGTGYGIWIKSGGDGGPSVSR
jgi:hypothetical protein